MRCAREMVGECYIGEWQAMITFDKSAVPAIVMTIICAVWIWALVGGHEAAIFVAGSAAGSMRLEYD
jgi:hypothetical protein